MEGTRTIAAISTAEGPGGIGIVRISGPKAFPIAQKVFKAKSGRELAACGGYRALLGAAYTDKGEKLDDVVALVFRSPKSYTGEDVVELSCHGGLYVTRQLLRLVLEAGAKAAGPGEFTRRAFLNGKVDLAQAEAVMQLIGASGQQAARAAQAVSSGALSKKIRGIADSIRDVAAHLAAWADFPEEDVPQVEEGPLRAALAQCSAELEGLLHTFEQGKVFREGVDTVICGRPNAGKSTLMNLLSGCERSIVTQYPGTTRDIVEGSVMVGGIPLHLADTAGLRDTADPVEKMGVTAARQRIHTAQLALLVLDSTQPLTEEDRELMEELADMPTVAVINKSDLPLQLDMGEVEKRFPHRAIISAATGQGLQNLEGEIAALLGTENFDPTAGILTTERQRAAVQEALDALVQAEEALGLGMTLDAVTVCVEAALSALYSFTGAQASEDIIDQVFEQFCVGK